jgi:hypothetical protein
MYQHKKTTLLIISGAKNKTANGYNEENMVILLGLFIFVSIFLPNAQAYWSEPRSGPNPLQPDVYAWPGRALMGCKSPMSEPSQRRET